MMVQIVLVEWDSEEVQALHMLMSRAKKTNNHLYSTITTVSVAGEAIAFMIAKDTFGVGEMDFTMAKVIIEVGVIATTMRVAIFVLGVNAFMMRKVISCIRTSERVIRRYA